MSKLPNPNGRMWIFPLANIILVAVLLYTAVVYPFIAGELFAILLFGFLMTATMSTGIQLGGGLMSLSLMVMFASLLAVGLLPTIWIVVLGVWGHGLVRSYLATELGLPASLTPMQLVNRTAANSVMLSTSLIFGAAVYGSVVQRPLVAGPMPLELPALVVAVLVYNLVNYLIYSLGAFVGLVETVSLHQFLRQVPVILLFESLPVVFAPLLAEIYLSLGLWYFSAFAVVLTLMSGIIFYLERTRQRLERRVREMATLSRISQRLGATLNLSEILETIYLEVSALMPTSTFFVALYDAEQDVVSFPLFIREGERLEWPARRAGNGLTEYVMHEQRPLLVRDNLDVVLEKLALKQIGTLAASWLGVPITGPDGPMGVISVQSISEAEVYDDAHQRLLTTVAAQAAVAIQNARLFAATDTALDQRVRELDSILDSTQDGILLLDDARQILAANRAFGEMFGLPEGEMARRRLDQWPTPEESLLKRIGYTPASFEADCQTLLTTQNGRILQQHSLGDPPRIKLERSLVPVRGDAEDNGWLLIFRDISEEVALEQVREEMMQMLVHDLRSPLTVMLSSLETTQTWLAQEEPDQVGDLLDVTQRSGQRLLRLINELMDIYRFESDTIPLQPVAIPARMLLIEAAYLLQEAAVAADIHVEIATPDGLPAVQADPNYIGRVFLNLLDNALKFTPDNSTITMQAECDETGRAIVFRVRDEGDGISPEFHSKIFDKFQNDLSRGARRRGTGLGLAYCRLVVEAHGGEIGVESTGAPGEGAMFWLTLPRA